MGIYFNFFNAHDKLLKEEKAHEEEKAQAQRQLDFIGANEDMENEPEPIRETSIETTKPIGNEENENTNASVIEESKGADIIQKGELENGNQSDLCAS
jgi:hypothetical protein